MSVIKRDFALVKTPHGHLHAADALVHARAVGQRADLRVRQVGVLLHAAQLLDLQVGQLNLLLRVDHLGLQLGESLQPAVQMPLHLNQFRRLPLMRLYIHACKVMLHVTIIHAKIMQNNGVVIMYNGWII